MPPRALRSETGTVRLNFAPDSTSVQNSNGHSVAAFDLRDARALPHPDTENGDTVISFNW